ncbi:MAG: cytochrome ubiquinol oxidase subunit I [Bacteroidales bacterium]|jgi:cytochrome d ubiquinol oxidase subunit I|nr:cytochrome ubiquinol oxidase subunit I [Bacteroidales bacterium]
MIENLDPSLVDWSRYQFALTAIYHWIFVPLTLGLAFIIAIMETIYVKTGDPEWKRITKFWMTLFGVNFAIGVATGIILEFEFGTNWSNYSWFVGDIFGAPLAIEGIMAFFMESTFIAIMFFGWNKVSKKFHLAASWLTAIGANLSALWILVANAWMQNPVGTTFNPVTARNEMTSFWDVALSSTAINKFLHTITQGYILGAIFVIGVSCWFLLKKREILFAKRSIIVAAAFGLIFSLVVIGTGDSSAKDVAKYQPMKFAAMEGLKKGSEGQGIVAFGILKEFGEEKNVDFHFKLEIPKMLSFLSDYDFNSFVPGIDDIIEGNEEHGLMPAQEKIERGKVAIDALRALNTAKQDNDTEKLNELIALFQDKDFKENYFKYFGYGYFKDTKDLIPNVPLVFYSFHIMVILGTFFVAMFALFLYMGIKNKIKNQRWLFYLGILSIPLVYVASQTGWIVAEVGRQPWVIQNLMPVKVAVSQVSTTTVQTTFWLFATIFTGLLIAELRIMFKQIKIGPKEGK